MIDLIVAFLLGATALSAYIDYWNWKDRNRMGLLPQFTVQKIGEQWVCTNLVKGLSADDRDAVITVLLEEIDKMDDGTSYGL